ncbi:MAG: SDR family oxidoreductase [Caldilinea sp. CFX5]|nr:SDR family oxidoreductase [Caldilinea sp. CFX5]
MSLNGKYALITGASRGIGRGIALKLAQSGANVAINYLGNEAAAKSTLAQVRDHGGGGFIIQADVSQPDDIRHLFSTVQAEFGKLDIFVSNARPEAAAFFYPPLEITLEQWDSAIDSQAKAFLLAARAAAKLMPDGGRILAITYATGGRTGSLQPWVAMGAAKAAMESLVRYYAVALAKRGITVNAISPGWTEDSVLNSLPEVVQTLQRNWHGAGWTPMGRLGTPADIGNVAALLCSPEASWITGQVIYADGGASLMNSEVAPEIQLG